jgi:hypothetical protein
MQVLEARRRVWHANQSWNYEAIIDAGYSFPLRVEVRRNAYDEQSFARVSAWGGPEQGWAHIAARAGVELACRVVSYTERDVAPERFAADEAALLSDAQFVLGRPVRKARKEAI